MLKTFLAWRKEDTGILTKTNLRNEEFDRKVFAKNNSDIIFKGNLLHHEILKFPSLPLEMF
jgi:hypothetical protein